MTRKIYDPFGDEGPIYNIDSAALRKHRRARHPDRRAYGEAVLAAVRAAQAASLRRAGETMPRPNCASGTALSDGADILKAVAAQHRAALLAYPQQVRKARTPEQWRKLYEAAMAEKYRADETRLAA